MVKRSTWRSTRLRRLEQRESCARVHAVGSTRPPRRRAPQAAIRPASITAASAPEAGGPQIVLDGFVLLETPREDPEEAQKAVLEGCGIGAS